MVQSKEVANIRVSMKDFDLDRFYASYPLLSGRDHKVVTMRTGFPNVFRC